MDRLISEQAVLEAFREYQGSISDFYKAVKAIPSAQDDDYVMIKRTTWEKIEKALDSVSARGC